MLYWFGTVQEHQCIHKTNILLTDSCLASSNLAKVIIKLNQLQAVSIYTEMCIYIHEFSSGDSAILVKQLKDWFYYSHSTYLKMKLGETIDMA